ncbi:MAG: hypothetical protein V4525_10445 [Pseudomonadota bacterium]
MQIAHYFLKSWKILIPILILLILFIYKIGSSVSKPTEPGVVITTQTYDKIEYIWPEYAIYPNGNKSHFASFRMNGSATGGGNSDDHSLPQWIEYYWREIPIIENDTRSKEQRLKAIDDAPIKHQRVMIASRIPQDVIHEAIEAVKKQEPGKLPNKIFSLYLTWYQGHIYFSWHLQTETETLHSGGDTCKNGKPINMQTKERCF